MSARLPRVSTMSSNAGNEVVGAVERAKALVFSGRGDMAVRPFLAGHVDRAAAEKPSAINRQSARVVSSSPPTCSISV